MKKYMMKQFLILMACVWGMTPAFAQTDGKAKELLDKAVAAVRAYPALEVVFDLEMVNDAEGIRELHHGKAYMRDSLYRVDVMDTENYYDGEVIYTYMPDAGEVNIKNPEDSEEEMLNPTILFDIHNQRFTQKLVSEEGGVAYIELTPKEEHPQMAKIGVWIEVAKNRVQRVRSFGKDGNDVVITIQSLQAPAQELTDDFFRFDTEAHPDVEVVDLR